MYNSKNFLTIYNNDVLSAKKELVISSPFISKISITRLLENFKALLNTSVKIKIITRPGEDFNGASRENMKAIFEILAKVGIDLVFKSNLYKKFAVIDNKVVWYGGINLLSYSNSEDSIMRLDNVEIANEILKDNDEEENEIPMRERFI